MKMSEIKIWISSFFATSGLALTMALFLVPTQLIPVVLLTAVTILLTIFVPIAIIRKAGFQWWRVLIGALYGLFWPLGLPIVVGVALVDLLPDDPVETEK